jgi:Tfp pilus assembly protein PilF
MFRALVTGALQFLEQRRPAEAEKNIRKALEMNPRDDQLLHLLGVALIRQSREEEAIEPLRKAISLNRRDAEYHNSLGCALRNAGRVDEGIECFLRALRIDPQLHDVHYNLALAHQLRLQFDKTEEHLRFLLARNPADVEAINALATLFWFVGEHERADQTLREGIERVPGSGDLRFSLGEQLLALGRFEEGWYGYLWRVNRHLFLKRVGLPFDSPRLLAPFEPSLAGRTVRVHAEQGIGDDLYFLRFVSFLRERGARVLGSVTPRLQGMIERSAVLDECTPTEERIPPGAEYRLLGDLPHLLRAHALAPPPPVRFEPLPARTEDVARRLAGIERPLIGLTWRAGTGPEAGNPNALYKEVPFPAFIAMARTLPGTLVVLQRAPKPRELEKLREACGPRVLDYSSFNGDLESMHALLAQIDDYVGVSNTNMHLCAALGRAARVLVSRTVEFRWMAEGDESPWFEGFRIYRQAPGGDWAPALARVASDLAGNRVPDPRERSNRMN